MSEEPLVTVIMPTRNRCHKLKQAIDSVRRQTYANIELIVVDDASEDGTERLLDSLKAKMPGLRTYRFEERQGANAARNFALREASGVFVTGLDDDDTFTPERVERLVKGYDDRYAFISAHSYVAVDNGKIFSETQKNEEVVLKDMYFKNIVGNQALAMRTRVLEAGLYDEKLSACQDYDLWLRLMRLFGKAKVLPDYLYIKYEGDDASRITISRNAFSGYFQFHCKYKVHYSTRQRKHRLFVLYRIRGKSLSWRTLRLLVTSHRPFRMLRYFMENNQEKG